MGFVPAFPPVGPSLADGNGLVSIWGDSGHHPTYREPPLRGGYRGKSLVKCFHLGFNTLLIICCAAHEHQDGGDKYQDGPTVQRFGQVQC